MPLRRTGDSPSLELEQAQRVEDTALAAVARTTADDWERATIEDGEPSVMPATAALWLPQMLNLDLIGGVSFGKGCYVGQENTARMNWRCRTRC